MNLLKADEHVGSGPGYLAASIWQTYLRPTLHRPAFSGPLPFGVPAP
jgi:hypothetical protein